MENNFFNLHDWILETITVNWLARTINVKIAGYIEAGYKKEVQIIAKSFYNLLLPRYEEWGKSESIMKAVKPEKYDKKSSIMKIEMQTGDVISIIAESIEILPAISIKLL